MIGDQQAADREQPFFLLTAYSLLLTNFRLDALHRTKGFDSQ